VKWQDGNNGIFTRDNFSILLLNIQGINSASKLALFENYVNSMKKSPTIIALCESWLNADEVKCLNFKHFALGAAFGRKKSNRGGVVLLVNKTSGIKWKVGKTQSIESAFETCSITVTIENRKIQLILIYRPSNAVNNSQLQSFFTNLENLVVDIIEPEKEVIILGDLNVDILKSNVDSRQLLSIMNAYQFRLCNAMKPTRTFNGSVSLIDQIFYNFECAYTSEVLPIIIIIISLYCIYVTSSCRWSTRRAHLQRCQKQNRKEIHTHKNTN
jgi:exonuclease III